MQSFQEFIAYLKLYLLREYPCDTRLMAEVDDCLFFREEAKSVPLPKEVKKRQEVSTVKKSMVEEGAVPPVKSGVESRSSVQATLQGLAKKEDKEDGDSKPFSPGNFPAGVPSKVSSEELHKEFRELFPHIRVKEKGEALFITQDPHHPLAAKMVEAITQKLYPCVIAKGGEDLNSFAYLLVEKGRALSTPGIPFLEIPPLAALAESPALKREVWVALQKFFTHG